MATDKFSDKEIGFPFTFINKVREKINDLIDDIAANLGSSATNTTDIATINTTIAPISATKGTDTGNTPTINAFKGGITTASLTAAAGAVDTITLTNSAIVAGSIVTASVEYGGAGTLIMNLITVTSGQAIFTLQNVHASAAFNAAATINFVVAEP